MKSAVNALIQAGRQIRTYLEEPRDLTALMPWTLDGMEMANRYGRKRFAAMARARQEALRQLGTTDVHIDPKVGYHVMQPKNLPSLQPAIAHCQQTFTRDFILATCSNKSKADTLLSAKVNLHDPAHAALKALALAPEILAPVGEYLDDLPALVGSYVWYSPNIGRNDLLGSQLFHYDREDVRQIKCFIPLDVIDSDTGPFTLIPCAESRRFLDAWRADGGGASMKQRFRDQDIFRVVGHDAEREMTGAVGDIVLVDTTNCLHYGSRPGSRGKYHITLHYISAFSRKLFRANLNGQQHPPTDRDSLVMQYYGADT